MRTRSSLTVHYFTYNRTNISYPHVLFHTLPSLTLHSYRNCGPLNQSSLVFDRSKSEKLKCNISDTLATEIVSVRCKSYAWKICTQSTRILHKRHKFNVHKVDSQNYP